METAEYLIIGGGAVGNAVAYELSRKTDKDIFVVDKNLEKSIENQSSRNSGVIHAGIYYPKNKGLNKSFHCVNGNRLMYEFCAEHKVPHKQAGKLVVATTPREISYLEDVVRIASENRVPEFKILSREEARLMEPNIHCIKALYFPTSGVVEPTSYVKTLRRLSKENGAYSEFGTEVIDIKPTKKGFIVTTDAKGSGKSQLEIRTIINAAGLYSDIVAKMINPDCSYEIEPIRGEAAKFYHTRRGDINMNGMNVYPAPYGIYNETGEKAEVSFKKFQELLKEGKVTKTVGVHLTPTLGQINPKTLKIDYFDKNNEIIVNKTVTIGPASRARVEREDYSSNLREKEYYLERVESFFPHLKLSDIELHHPGIRAKLKDHYDFVIERDSLYSRAIHLVGIDSPGLTASLSIAEYVVDNLIK